MTLYEYLRDLHPGGWRTDEQLAAIDQFLALLPEVRAALWVTVGQDNARWEYPYSGEAASRVLTVLNREVPT